MHYAFQAEYGYLIELFGILTISDGGKMEAFLFLILTGRTERLPAAS